MTSSTTADAGQGTPGRRSPRSRGLPRKRRWRVGLAVLLTGVVLLIADVVVLTQRLDRLPLDLPGASRSSDGQTWVLVGLDSRTDLPDGADVSDFGSAEDVPGSRADVILVLHRTAAGPRAFSVPRDVVVRTDRRPGRLALTWRQGPQATVAGLCQLGIPTDHLVTVDLAGFASVVDAVGGLDVDVPEAVRDPAAGLLLPQGGRQHVDGATALAMVRSRHPEHLVEGNWTAAPVDPDGRASAAGTVLAAVADAARASVVRPWRLQQVAWAASGAVSLDPDTSVAELTSLATDDLGAIPVLPVSEPLNGTLARRATEETARAVAQAGLSCHD
jgi:LCP family protein required for cell wall assembly